MDTEFSLPSGRQIVNAVCKPKRTTSKIKTDSLNYFMNLFMLNKLAGFNAGLAEIKTMTPQEGYLFTKQVINAAMRIKEMRKKRGT